jgi:hypothetical protein
MSDMPVCQAVAAVHAEFLAEATARFPRQIPFGGDGSFVEDHLDELTGIADLRTTSQCRAVTCNDRILIVGPRWSWNNQRATDRWLFNSAWVSGKLAADESVLPLPSMITREAHWLQLAPQNRIVLDNSKWHDEILVVMVWVRLDVLDARARRPSPSEHRAAVSPPLLHDVMATLHGYARRVAGTVCKTWLAAAHDVHLPVTNDDVRAWVEPRIADVKRAYPPFVFNVRGVEILWVLMRYWLEGGE